MARFVSLLNWTDQGAKTAADTVDRAEAAKKLAADMGGSLELYWTMGQYDLVAITEFADDVRSIMGKM
ncbi:MAG: GYD domain-containing protein [Actinobacteria bacterium]|nr:GYD domain-containing protein [Actinomycetota bacterium]